MRKKQTNAIETLCGLSKMKIERKKINGHKTIGNNVKRLNAFNHTGISSCLKIFFILNKFFKFIWNKLLFAHYNLNWHTRKIKVLAQFIFQITLVAFANVLR